MPSSKERARKRAREHYLRQQRARQVRLRKIRQWALAGTIIVLVAGLAVGLSLAFVGGGSPKASPKAKASATPSATSTAAAVTEPAHHCTYTSQASTDDVVKATLPPSTPDWNATYTATISTNRGPIVIKLANSKATCTVNSFVHLAETKFWDNTQCHRVSDSSPLYMLQCGDPTAKGTKTLSCSGANEAGTGGPGYSFDDENLKGATYPAGTLAMANSGANTNGSQFFLVFQNTDLPASYTPFGTITSGLDILQNVAKAGTSCTYAGAGGGVPKDKVVINSVSIKQA
ncbi:MAG TPA: peptidylprolyl isomerase [Trebonia sp.]|nr:peptidylprolyl isomerase [Trebonia sp.]